MEYSTLLFNVQDGVAEITLNRPEALNSINLELARDLMYAALRCDEDSKIRAVVIHGAGNHFCAGGDLKTFASKKENLAHYFKEVTTYLHSAISRLIRMEPPVVAAVHGNAVGAGMGLALACDIVVASESARFNMAYTRVGLTPDGSSTYFLPRLVGLKRALELTLTNRMLSAKEAFEWGIVTKVVREEELMTQAHLFAKQFASGAPKALGAAKRLLHNSWVETLETQIEYESQTISAMAHTSDTLEGISAFLEKRSPKYRGE